MKKQRHIHFVGIGGIGLSSIAHYFLSLGFLVSGSDSSDVNFNKKGTAIFKGHCANNIKKTVDLVVYSNAIELDNPEILRAKELNIEVKSYPEVLGEITKKFYTIAVSGTHGKSTTTAMIALMMIDAGLDPTVIIGTKLRAFNNSNFRGGKSKYLVIEADEFKAAFLNYYPKIAVITNIEEDHLDFYKDINDIVTTFQNYVKNNLKKGLLILNKDDKNSLSLKKHAKGNILEYSLKQDICKNIKLSIPGKHNISNALSALCVAKELKISESVAINSLKSFKGTWRRFEEGIVKLKNGHRLKIINDYAHHPTEIKVTVEAVKEKYPNKEIIIVFQPHQYERTYRLFEKFRDVLSNCDVKKILITDIYTVKGRESKEIIKKVSAKKLSKKIKSATYTGDLKATANYILEYLHGKEIIVIMGAGDINNLQDLLKK